MRAIFIVAFCTVYSAQATWFEDLGSLHIETHTGQLPAKHAPTQDDKKATRKATAFVNFIKVVPQLNPRKRSNAGPYHFKVAALDIEGDVQLQSVVVNGIKDVTLQNVYVQMAPALVQFNATAPLLSADVDFTLNAHKGSQPLNVKGHVKAQLHGLAISGTVEPVVKTYSYPVYELDSGDILIDLNDLQVTVSLDQYENQFKDILVHFAHNLQQYPDIVDDILRAVFNVIGKELGKVPASEIVQYLVGPGKQKYLG